MARRQDLVPTMRSQSWKHRDEIPDTQRLLTT
jgi:hypothetical protein